MLETIFSFGVGVVASIIGSYLYDKFFKKQ